VSGDIFVGDGMQHPENRQRIPDLPPWRLRQTTEPPVFEPPKGLAVAVNAALRLRRPLLITGGPGSGKSTLATVIADELELGDVLRWHINSKSTLNEGLYEYDALGRLHATQVPGADDKPENFVTLGPLGTGLADSEIRVVLIDEIDKSDLDLPGDLLNVIEHGAFRIPVLARAKATVLRKNADTGENEAYFPVTGADNKTYEIDPDGMVWRRQFPVIVFTSNGGRTFPAPFLRRCVRFPMPAFEKKDLEKIVRKHLGEAAEVAGAAAIAEFARKLEEKKELAVNQILEYIYIITGDSPPDSASSKTLKDILLKELNGK
jgi:MoxR-like ATPase